LVTDPDLRSAKEARVFSEELQLILRYLNISNADMEKGQMRCEANVSVRKEGTDALGTKVEIKNLNSFKSLEKGIDFEIKRQEELLSKGEKVIQETRGYNATKEETYPQREKEEAHDYRYFPEPDLPILHFNEIYLKELKGEIGELPSQRRERFKEEYRLEDKETEAFVTNKELGEYFEQVISELKDWMKEKNIKDDYKLIRIAANYILSDFQGLLKEKNVNPKSSKITGENFAEFITLIHEGKILSKIAKMVLLQMFETGKDPSNIIEESGLLVIEDEGLIRKAVEEILSLNKKAVEDIRKGKENALQFLVGQVMAKTKGRANPETARGILKEIIR